jgi:predicted metalloendopeptidase
MDRNVTNALGSGPYYRRNTILNNVNADDHYLLEIWRLMREAQDLLTRRPELNHEEMFRQMRVRFMVGEFTEDEWKTALQRAEKDMHFSIAKNQVNDVFVNASRDLIRQVLDKDCDKSAIRKQVEELVEYCNNSYKSITARFNRKTSLIVYKPRVSAKIPEVTNPVQQQTEGLPLPSNSAVISHQ